MSTIKDVAKKAGVSTATVSRVLNGKGEASPETIQKINRIAKELDYKPNTLARSLSKRKTNLIALLIPNLNNPFFSELVTEIERAANARGYQIYLCNSEDDREKVEFYLNAMTNHFVVGAIINSLFVTENDLKKLQKNGVATITIDRATDSHTYSSVTVDQEKGGYLAAQHLIQDCGCQNLLIISGPDAEATSRDRLRGYQKAVNEFNGHTVDILGASFDTASGYDAFFRYMKNRENSSIIDGVFCSNDAMALGVLRACKDLEISVPEEIKVIGFDNIHLGSYAIPRLSSIDQLKAQASELVLEELEKVISGVSKPQKYTVTPELITRESTFSR